MNAIKNYGFSEDLIEIEPEAYILGVNSKLPNIVYRPDGQWPTVLYEPQAENFESWGCTVWGAQNQAEMFEKEVFGIEPNYDERFTYLNAGVKEGGANPQQAYESVRLQGVIDNEPIPETFERFLDRAYLTKDRINRGQNWRRTEKDYLHDYLPDTTKQTIKANLIFSPIGLSVTAWMTDEDGFYIDGGQRNTHWCVSYGYVREQDAETSEKLNALAEEFHVKPEALKKMVNEGKIVLKVLDSYDHSKKLLHPDHRIFIAKRIHVRKREKGEDTFTEAMWLEKIWEVIKKIQKILGIPTGNEPAPVPALSNREKLYEVSKASISKEMSPNDIAPDELACVESLNEVYKKAFGTVISMGLAYTSTAALLGVLASDGRFKGVHEPLFGDIIISPTGAGNGTIRGHCGVIGKSWIMSNDSRTGKWEPNYTLAQWTGFFNGKGELPVHFFRVR